MHAQTQVEYVSFSRPIVGPKVYLARGPSGHVETFNRVHADRELELFLGHVTLKIAIEGFLHKLIKDRRIEAWSDVLEYLSQLVGLDDFEAIPIDVGVSFWAHADLEREAIRRAKLLAKRTGN